MSPTARVAKLELLLARVIDRKSPARVSRFLLVEGAAEPEATARSTTHASVPPEAQELELPSSGGTSRPITAQRPLEFEPSKDSLEVDHHPHASAMPPRPDDSERSVDLAGTDANRTTTRRATIPERPFAMPRTASEASPDGVDPVVPALLPKDNPVNIIGAPGRMPTFNVLLQRSLSLRWRP